MRRIATHIAGVRRCMPCAQVFEGVLNRNGERTLSRELTPEEKKRRVVLKRVNLDGSELRQNFIRAGTMARVRGSPGPPMLPCYRRQIRCQGADSSSPWLHLDAGCIGR